MIRSSFVILCAFILIGSIGVATHGGSGGSTDEHTDRIAIPLRDGRLHLSDLLSSIWRAMDETPPEEIAEIDQSIDVKSLLGGAQMHWLEQVTDGGMRIEISHSEIMLSLDRTKLDEVMKDAGEVIDAWLARVAGPFTTRESAPGRFGLTVVTEQDERASLEAYAASKPTIPGRIVVLVHGLDDPGWLWRDVIRALRNEGVTVARFEYPNDGPISDAADLLALALLELRAIEIESIDIVAHSMGGLVARDVLTRHAFYGGDGSGGDRLPAVDRLIMCGTPNHGSEMARLRTISEFGEQISRAFAGDHAWNASTEDGSGEAAVDLLPGSIFLERLNERPMASHTRHHVIAGRLSPILPTDLDELRSEVKRVAQASGAPRWLHELIDHADASTARMLDEAVTGLGDGCVSLDSARLNGAASFTVVSADHIGMIVNVTGAGSTPPAVPLILEHLELDPDRASDQSEPDDSAS